MQAVDMYDWKKVEMHYAQYSPKELEAMCTLSRCLNCKSKRECDDAKEKSYQNFLAQVH